MELFTFFRMGGGHEQLRLYALSGVDARSNIAAFDAANAHCFLDKDRHGLLAVIETGFGDITPFNRVVRRALDKVDVKSAQSTDEA